MGKRSGWIWGSCNKDNDICMTCPRLATCIVTCQLVREHDVARGAVNKANQRLSQWGLYFDKAKTSMRELSLTLGRKSDYVYKIWIRKSKLYERTELEEIEEAAKSLGCQSVTIDGMERILKAAGFKEADNRVYKGVQPVTAWAMYFSDMGVSMRSVSNKLGRKSDYVYRIWIRKSKLYERTELEEIEEAAKSLGCQSVTIDGMEAILSGYGFHAVASLRKPMEPVPVGSIKITAPMLKKMREKKTSDQWAMYFLGKGVSMEKLSLKIGRSQNYVFSIWRRKSKIYTRVELEEAEAVSGGAVLADEMEAVLVGAGFRAVETLNHGRKKKT